MLPSRFLSLLACLALTGVASALPPTLTTIDVIDGANEDQNTTISYATLAAAANEADPEGDTIEFSFESLIAGELRKNGGPVPPNGTLGTGESWVWTPPDDANGVINALSEQQTTAAELTLRREDRRLELLIHFKPNQSEIPENCMAKLDALNRATKTGRSGPILIRSSTQTEGSSELDLALASQRLDALQYYFRDNRLARKAFVLELHPEASSPLFGDAMSLPNVVEIYSSPTN